MGGMRMPNGVRKPQGSRPKAMSPTPMASPKGPSFGANGLNTAGPNMGFKKGGAVSKIKSKMQMGGGKKSGSKPPKSPHKWTKGP